MGHVLNESSISGCYECGHAYNVTIAHGAAQRSTGTEKAKAAKSLVADTHFQARTLYIATFSDAKWQKEKRYVERIEWLRFIFSKVRDFY